MYFQAINPSLHNALVEAMLQSLSARPAGALLTTPTLHLYTSSTKPPSPASVPGDFTEATFVGYAAIVLPTLVGPVVLTNQDGWGMLANATFLAGAVVAPGQNIAGYWIDDGATTLYVAEAFPSAYQFTQLGDFLDMAIMFPMLTPVSAQ